LRNAPRLAARDFSDRVESGGDDFGSDARVDEFVCEFADDGFEDVGGCEVVCGLGEGDEDGGDTKLVVCEVSAGGYKNHQEERGKRRTW
jgi:hypothetical protein